MPIVLRIASRKACAVVIVIAGFVLVGSHMDIGMLKRMLLACEPMEAAAEGADLFDHLEGGLAVAAVVCPVV